MAGRWKGWFGICGSDGIGAGTRSLFHSADGDVTIWVGGKGNTLSHVVVIPSAWFLSYTVSFMVSLMVS
jgi:hypothetical protein